MRSVFSLFLVIAVLYPGNQAVIKQVATPVVFTNNAGGGVDELQLPPSRKANKLFDAGGPVTAAWWVPFNNIRDLSAITHVDVTPSGNNVNLVVRGRHGQPNGRVRIKIFAELGSPLTSDDTPNLDIRFSS